MKSMVCKLTSCSSVHCALLLIYIHRTTVASTMLIVVGKNIHSVHPLETRVTQRPCDLDREILITCHIQANALELSPGSER